MGIMHETCHAPKWHWETIYDNMPLWGLGKSKGFYYVNILLQKAVIFRVCATLKGCLRNHGAARANISQNYPPRTYGTDDFAIW
jgi:hypothetical protein